jgi:DNA-binding NtrC family response regulator
MAAPFVMLVDDEVDFVETTAKRLEKRNIETITAFGGEECLKKLKTNQTIDAIVLDVKMPGMDGLETLKRIKQDFPLMEVIMLTGHATMEYGIRSMKLGAYDFLTKPFDIETLVAILIEAADKKQSCEAEIKDIEHKDLLLKYEP